MAKANYYKSEVEQNVGNPKEIWRTINAGVCNVPSSWGPDFTPK